MSTSIHAGVTELNALTDTYFQLDGGSVWDVLHNTSYAVNYFDKQKKGLFKVCDGGAGFEFPLIHDKVNSQGYNRGSLTINRAFVGGGYSANAFTNQVVTTAVFPIMSIVSSTKILRLDQLQNSGAQKKADLVKTRVDSVLATHAESMAKSLYQAHDYAPGWAWSGILHCAYALNPTQGNFGGLAYNGPENDVWVGRRNDCGNAPITFSILRTLRRTAKFKDGPGGRPAFCTLNEDLFASLQDIAGSLIRLEGDKEAAKFGFTAIIHEGMTIAADDFAPADTACLFNVPLWGVRFLKGGHHDKTKWFVMENTPGDSFMDVFANGNWVTPARNAHIIGTNLKAE